MKDSFFDKYNFLFEDTSIPYVMDSFHIISNGEILLKNDININNAKSNKDIFEIYSVRKNNLEDLQDIIDYDYLLLKLKKLKNEFPIKSLIIIGKDSSYTFFYDDDNKNLIAILKYNELNLDKINKLNSIYISKGLSIDYLKYFKGELTGIIKSPS